MFKKFLFIAACFCQVIGATVAIPAYGSTSSEEILPYGGVVDFESQEQKIFTFCRGTITLINGREEFLWLLTWCDEGVPLFAIIKSFEGYGSHGVHYACQVPCKGENVIVIIDESYK